MLRITDMENGVADVGGLTAISHDLSAQYARTVVEAGDVVLSVVGTIGETLVVDERLAGVNLSRAVARVRCGKRLSARFLAWVFRSSPFLRFVELMSVGAAQKVLNMGDLSNFAIAIPAWADQERVADYLDIQTQAIDRLVIDTERAITLLQERRAALISAAVTGRIDVRGLADPAAA